MMLPSTLAKAIKLSIAVTVAGSVLAATGAFAQNSKRIPRMPQQYRNLPWQDTLEKHYRAANPQSEIDKARSTLFRDPTRVLGLPSNEVNRQRPSNAPSAAPAAQDPAMAQLDVNGDGAISRSEYFQGRSRSTSLGYRSGTANQRQNQRLRSQFRDTDFNRDGKVTPDELQARGVGRF